MAQTRKKRRRKHSGTQAGTIQRQAAAERAPRTKDERREAARRRRVERLERPPTLRGSVGRAAAGAAIFAVLVILAFGRPPLEGISLGLAMFVLYIPIGYLIDLFIYRRHQRKKRRSGEAGGGGGRREDAPRKARG